MPKPIFFDLLNCTLESLSTLGQPTPIAATTINTDGGGDGVPPLQISTLEQVLAFEHCMCIHEMLKEIHFWLDRAD